MKMEELYSVDNMTESQTFSIIPVILHDDNDFTCARLIENLEKNLAVVRFEASHVVRINSDLDNKLTEFHETSSKLASKVEALETLSETHFCKNCDFKGFIAQISSSWVQVNKERYLKYHKIRVASRMTKDLPLVQLLNKIKKEADEIKSMLQVCECNCDRQCVPMGFFIHEEISRLIECLENCDDKVQLLLAISEITPQLIDLISPIDDFISHNEIIPLNRPISEDLSVFPILSKLLTGELLGHEPMNPDHILITNAPKKPVFITKKKKRKVDAPQIKITKILRKS